MHHYCSVFPLLPSPWGTWNNQALTAMPSGLHQGLGGVPLSAALGPFLQDNWHFCWKVKQYIPPGSSRRSFAGCLARRCSLSAPKLSWLGHLLLGARADQVLTRAGSNPMSSIEKSLCVPWVFIVSFQFSQGLGSGRTVTFLSNLSSSWVQKKKMPKKYMKDSCSPVFSHYGLCEVETSFFSSKGEKKNAFLL